MISQQGGESFLPPSSSSSSRLLSLPLPASPFSLLHISSPFFPPSPYLPQKIFPQRGHSRVKIIGGGGSAGSVGDNVGVRLFVTYFNEFYLIGNTFNTRTLIYSNVCYNNNKHWKYIKKKGVSLEHSKPRITKCICIDIWL